MDVKKDIETHMQFVRDNLHKVIESLTFRGEFHDQSKLIAPEFEIFDEYTSKLKATTYGSDEYKQYLKEMGVALDHHYANNRHHPEYFENGIDGMTLVDLTEMLCDWMAAVKKHADGDIYKSLDINRKRFNMTDQLFSILTNTVKQLEK